MKAFTPLMKLCIAAVTITLAAMLVISAAPIVMGGVNVEKEEDIQIVMNGANLEISGKYIVESSMDREINDLMLEAYLQSKDGQTMTLFKVPSTTISKGKTAVIDLSQSIPIAEVAVFFITDNMDNGETKGVVLPINIHIKGSYSDNLAGLDMHLVYDYVISETGSFKIDKDNTETTTSGEISKAKLDITGVDPSFTDLIPSGGATFEVEIGGKTITLDIDSTGDEVNLEILTGDLDNTSISEVIHDILDAVDNKSDEVISFDFGGETYEVNPSEIDTEQAQEYMDQIEGIVGSLDSFLKKYADMMKGGA